MSNNVDIGKRISELASISRNGQIHLVMHDDVHTRGGRLNPKVQHKGIVGKFIHPLQGLFPGSRGRDLIALELEHFFQDFTHRLFIIQNQYFLFHAARPSLFF